METEDHLTLYPRYKSCLEIAVLQSPRSKRVMLPDAHSQARCVFPAVVLSESNWGNLLSRIAPPHQKCPATSEAHVRIAHSRHSGLLSHVLSYAERGATVVYPSSSKMSGYRDDRHKLIVRARTCPVATQVLAHQRSRS